MFELDQVSFTRKKKKKFVLYLLRVEKWIIIVRIKF